MLVRESASEVRGILAERLLRRTALGRFVLGSVSQRVLTEALCSVRIARGRVEESNSPVRIIVGTDGSTASEEALRAVAARQWPPQSEVMVVLVDDPSAPEFLGKLIPPLGETIEEDRREERAWVEGISARSIEILHAASIKVTCVVKEGDPKRELCKAAEVGGLIAFLSVRQDSAIALRDLF